MCHGKNIMEEKNKIAQKHNITSEKMRGSVVF